MPLKTNFSDVSKIDISATICVLGPSATIFRKVLIQVLSYELLFLILFYFHFLFALCTSRGIRYMLDNYEKLNGKRTQF